MTITKNAKKKSSAISMPVTELTPDHLKKMEKYAEKWQKINLSTERANRPKVEKTITKLYKLLNLKKPTFAWFDSPLKAQIEMNKRMGNDPGQYIPTSLLGNQDAYWIAFYLYCRDEVGVVFTKQQSDIINCWRDIGMDGGWWYAYDENTFCVDRPAEIHFNEKGQLHNENGPAIRYADGWKLFSVRGIALPGWIIERPELITEEVIAKADNEAVREIMRERMLTYKKSSETITNGLTIRS